MQCNFKKPLKITLHSKNEEIQLFSRLKKNQTTFFFIIQKFSQREKRILSLIYDLREIQTFPILSRIGQKKKATLS